MTDLKYPSEMKPLEEIPKNLKSIEKNKKIIWFNLVILLPIVAFTLGYVIGRYLD